jgi:hypothetical protein
MVRTKMGKTYCYEDFITEEERIVIKNWVIENMSLIRDTTHTYRKMSYFEEIPNHPECISKIKEKLYSLEYNDLFHPTHNTNNISVHFAGANIVTHLDPPIPTLSDYYKRRYNLMISMAEGGGELIYDGEMFKLKEKSIVCIDAGIIHHSTTVVTGETPRILLSFGYAIKKLSTF